MSSEIPASHVDLFDKPTIAHLATLMPDGRPQVTPVWCDFDGTHVRVNSVKGRRKDRNMRRDPRVTLSMCDPDDPNRYLEVRGTVVNITEDGAQAHIDALAMKYMGYDTYREDQPGEVRLIYQIAPEQFSKMG